LDLGIVVLGNPWSYPLNSLIDGLFER